jgi:uncharacterized protein
MLFKRKNPSVSMFELLLEMADLLIKSSEYLHKRSNSKVPPTYHDFIYDQETKSDDVAMRAKDVIMKSFILPLDKEDVNTTVEILDSITDSLERVENRLNIYKITPNDAVKDFTKLMVDCSHNIKIGLREIAQESYNSSIFITTCHNLNTLESKGDRSHRKHLEKLMNDEKIKPNELMKMREVYQIMEDTLNLCEKLAGHFDEIRIKYA